MLVDYQTRLDELAQATADAFNALHTTGYDQAGAAAPGPKTAVARD